MSRAVHAADLFTFDRPVALVTQTGEVQAEIAVPIRAVRQLPGMHPDPFKPGSLCGSLEVTLEDGVAFTVRSYAQGALLSEEIE